MSCWLPKSGPQEPVKPKPLRYLIACPIALETKGVSGGRGWGIFCSLEGGLDPRVGWAEPVEKERAAFKQNLKEAGCHEPVRGLSR